MDYQKMSKSLVGLIFLLFAGNAFSYSGGITGFSNSPMCDTCHTSGIVPTVVLAGSTAVEPGSTNSYSFTITGGQQQTGGLNISTNGGLFALQSGDISLKIQNGELTHTQPAAIIGSRIVWNFDWQAPLIPGAYVMYGAGLSANDDKGPAGDNAAKHQLTITVGTTGPVPIAIISAPQTALLNADVTFDGSGSSAPAGATLAQFEWSTNGSDFVVGTDTYISSFSSTGRHTVTLRITDSNNDVATIFADIIIGDQTVPEVKHTGPYTGEAGTAVTFDASASITDSSTSIGNYVWDFGDASPVEQGSSVTITHIYTIAGTYTVTITAQDGNGKSGVDNSLVTITTPSQPETGQQIYNEKCLSCHGPGGEGIAGDGPNIINATKIMIDSAMTRVPMDTIVIDAAQTLLVEDYLALTGATGEELYIDHCQVCHGVAGAGIINIAPPVIGTTRLMTLVKINSIPIMNGISVNSAESQLIANFLGSAATPGSGSSYYENKCSICHGATGAGIPGVGPPVNGATQLMITEAINQVLIMDGIILSNSNAQLVADFLGQGGDTGQEAYHIKCAICHGEAGIGRTGYGPFVRGATDFMITGEVNNVAVMQGINLQGKSQIIADYLGSGGSTGKDYYDNKCLLCHGVRGIGGSGTYGGPNIQGETADEFIKAIDGEKEMNGILLSDPEALAIESYLR
ncbi:MAG: choice-of-anchor V domain-containing protein [Gammaproteobacteria bacterium]